MLDLCQAFPMKYSSPLAPGPLSQTLLNPFSKRRWSKSASLGRHGRCPTSKKQGITVEYGGAFKCQTQCQTLSTDFTSRRMCIKVYRDVVSPLNFALIDHIHGKMRALIRCPSTDTGCALTTCTMRIHEDRSLPALRIHTRNQTIRGFPKPL